MKLSNLYSFASIEDNGTKANGIEDKALSSFNY